MNAPSLTALLQKGETAFASGDLEEAGIYFEKILRADPIHFEALNNLGVIAFHQTDYAKAIICFEKALQINSRYEMSIENLANCFILQGQYEKAVDLLQKNPATGLNSAEWLGIMARCALHLNDPNTARSWVARLQERNGSPDQWAFLSAWLNLHEQNKQGDYAARSWCREHAAMIRRLQGVPGLNMTQTRVWEYPFVFKKVMEKPNSRIIDIGAGDGALAALLAEHGHSVVAVDHSDSCRTISEREMPRSGLKYLKGDARNLAMIPDNQFDTALLVSVIEHIPSNTIWCEKRQTRKTGSMLREELPEKVKVLSEALRVVKAGGRLILTSDIYLDYPPDMNISWKELLGLTGIDREHFSDPDDLYITDNPIHKGRVLAVGMVIEKK